MNQEKYRLLIHKSDSARRVVFGWASIARESDGSTVKDCQGDIIDIDELERAVYDYVILYRDGGEMHERGGVAVLVESCVFTQDKMTAMGIPEGTLPYGWWIGLKVLDDDVWAKVKDGTYGMFSIEGEAVREENHSLRNLRLKKVDFVDHGANRHAHIKLTKRQYEPITKGEDTEMKPNITAEPPEDLYKGLNPTVKAELESLRKFRRDTEEREIMEVAKRYAILGKTPEELAPVLKSLKALGGSAYDDLISVLNSSLAAVEQAGAFSEIGKRGSDTPTGDDAWGSIEAAAREIVKSRPGIRYADAIDAACMAHPDLVEEYEKARR